MTTLDDLNTSLTNAAKASSILAVDIATAQSNNNVLTTTNGQLKAALDAANATSKQLKTALDTANARIAELEKQALSNTLYGVNASSKADHDANLPLVGQNAAWRYYHQPGEALTYPTEYALGPGESFVYSAKVLPKDLTLDKLVALFKSAPTDRPFRYCVWHEPEDDIKGGRFTVTEYKDAWARARQAQQQVGSHILLTPILMGYTWSKSSGRNPDDYIPVAANYDELLVDQYFDGVIGGSVSGIPTSFDPMIARAQKDGKRWGAAELGVGTKVSGQVRLDALTLLAKTVRLKGATIAQYFNVSGWSLDATAAKAWQAGQK